MVRNLKALLAPMEAPPGSTKPQEPPPRRRRKQHPLRRQRQARLLLQPARLVRRRLRRRWRQHRLRSHRSASKARRCLLGHGQECKQPSAAYRCLRPRRRLKLLGKLSSSSSVRTVSPLWLRACRRVQPPHRALQSPAAALERSPVAATPQLFLEQAILPLRFEKGTRRKTRRSWEAGGMQALRPRPASGFRRMFKQMAVGVSGRP
mmetsp:Transcript_22320/g.63902  ORF Transcript_22320/g.63902 Transcript_22320/m.63902 type:complete len:206 (+) Transcript_22320:2378-2995(+)